MLSVIYTWLVTISGCYVMLTWGVYSSSTHMWMSAHSLFPWLSGSTEGFMLNGCGSYKGASKNHLYLGGSDLQNMFWFTFIESIFSIYRHGNRVKILKERPLVQIVTTLIPPSWQIVKTSVLLTQMNPVHHYSLFIVCLLHVSLVLS